MSEATPSDPLADAEDEDELFLLFETSAKVLARSGDPSVFLDWIAKHGPSLAPRQARMIDPRTGLLDLSRYNMLRHVLDTLPKKTFAGLPASRVDAFAVCETARQWHEEGDTESAVALLEPWFAGDAPLAGKLEPLFDQLMDCYLALGKERMRARLLADALARGDRILRTAALQRRTTMLADKGDTD